MRDSVPNKRLFLKGNSPCSFDLHLVLGRDYVAGFDPPQRKRGGRDGSFSVERLSHLDLALDQLVLSVRTTNASRSWWSLTPVELVLLSTCGAICLTIFG